MKRFLILLRLAAMARIESCSSFRAAAMSSGRWKEAWGGESVSFRVKTIDRGDELGQIDGEEE